MHITLLQTDIAWEDNEANRAQLGHQLAQVHGTHLIVLPEMFNTGFSTHTSGLAESMDGPTVAWMRKLASEKKAAVTGSIIIQEGDTYYNRMLWVRPDGTLSHYDKRHLFRMAGEHAHFESGKQRVILEHMGWRILLQVCYDLRFPVYARNQYKDGRYEYDLALYVANWPSPRHTAWTTLLRARAMENLTYCAGVNRIGSDGNGLDYKGGSAIIDYLGKPLSEGAEVAGLLEATLSLDELRQFREKFPTGMDADPFTLMA